MLMHPTTPMEHDALRIVTRPCPDDAPTLRRHAFHIVASLGGRELRQIRAVAVAGAPVAQVIPFRRRSVFRSAGAA